ncbi:MAG: hypothetical protein CVT98_06660 [Bacteroidetes bacterium HGW-Bacteroidetes-15]|nr:MAG: hypothetical protein CVT98_06660 [Bacteroidetes bacterium HGW-Bacteroidetes-15]
MRSIQLFSLFIFLASSIMGQEDDANITISRSTDKVKIEGKYYYIHIVGKGETLYSISKAYNVTQIEIAMENPDIYLGLQIDQALKIPIKDQQILSSDEDENFIYHIVRRKETLFGLARKYQIAMQDIIAVNPEIEEGLRANQVVLIPKKQIESLGDSSPHESERFIYHEVKPREGFYAISKKYGVSEEIIKRFNVDLVKDGIKLGTVLKIPRSTIDTTYKEDVVATKHFSMVDPTELISPNVICDTFVYNKWRDKFNIALLLPFTQSSDELSADDIDETLTERQDQNQSQQAAKIAPQTANFLDFYQGALMAIDSLKQIGLSVNLNVYNTDKNSAKAKELTLDPGVSNANLIIGPAYQECLKPIAEFALQERIPMVSPLSPNNFLLDRNPYLFQVNPSFLSQLDEFTKMIDLCSGQNIVLVHEGDSTNLAMLNSFKEMLSKRIAECPMSGLIHFKEVSYKAGSPAPDVQEQISHSLVFDRDNFILVPSNNEVFVSDLLGNLHTLSTIFKYPISVYGFPRWQKFRNVQVDYYYQLQLTLFTPFYIDYNSGKVKSFITKYRDAFRSEPSQYSFQGFDVVFYFLSAMKNYGVDFQHCLSNHSNSLLQSNYLFEKVNSLGGYENRSVYLIRYTKDFDIIKVDKYKKKPDEVIPSQYINEPGIDKKEAVILK